MAKLALVMIAKDEARCIGRALASVRPHIDEMIVLDTGSSDQTPAIAAACGARVHRFDWCDDFSAARNAGLAYSDADWNLILDADEWLEGSGGALAAWVAARATDQRRLIGEVQIANRHPDGAGISRSWMPRLLPRGVAYTGLVHEQPDSTVPRERTSLVLGHDGYLAEALSRKSGRNEQLLRRELEAAPDDAYLWYQLGREHQARGRRREAAECLTKAYNLCPALAPYRLRLVVSAITALKDAGDLEEARALADAEAAHWPDSPDLWFAVGDLYLEWSNQNPGEALNHGLRICEFAWKRCLEIGERDDLDGSVQGKGGYMAAHNLAVLYETLGIAEEAAAYRAMSERLRSPGLRAA